MRWNYQAEKNTRLKEYDYSQNGAYFITICAYGRNNLLGEVVGQGLCSCRLSGTGEIIEKELLQLPIRYKNIIIDKYVIMPNHIHVIIVISNERQEQSPCPTLGDIICAYKSITTKLVNKEYSLHGRKIWQRSYHDHIIRNHSDYLRIWRYIDENPLKWQEDEYYEKDCC